MKWIETITPKQAVEELGVPYHGWMREMDRAWISEDQMPNDQRALVLARGMSDERPEKFAGNGKKSVRRGGS